MAIRYFQRSHTHRLVKAFALVESREMEAAPPSPLVKFGSTVIVPVYDVFVIGITVFSIGLPKATPISLRYTNRKRAARTHLGVSFEILLPVLGIGVNTIELSAVLELSVGGCRHGIGMRGAC
jgi:hypothetical protein